MHAPTALLALSLPLAILAHGPVFAQDHEVVHRRAAAPVASSSRVTVVRAAAAVTATTTSATKKAVSAVTALPTGAAASGIKSGVVSSFATSSLGTTFAAGATPTAIKGAPPLPDFNLINPKDYPALDLLPPIDSAQMKKWISEIDMTNVPKIAPTQPGGCANATNAAALRDAGADKNCWWTCGHCTRAEDITFCPAKGTWGLSYDDGPSPSTPKLLNFLDSQDLLATFFVVGSRAISRPQMLQTTYMQGHQISVHTWAHSMLTTLSNEGIIAELAWSKAIIKAVTGVTPNTMRPPYGDIDDRVRYISKQLGLTPIVWTSTAASTYDTQDWLIVGGQVPVATVLQNFETIINGSTKLDTGFIVLEHDLNEQCVDLSVNYVLPQALNFKPALTLEPIITCLGQDLSQAYIETHVASAADNTTAGSSGVKTISGGASSTGASAAGSTGSSKSAGVMVQAGWTAVLLGFAGAVLVR
ncbi:hypothetical protein RQP46_000082 [Phenoliferia psychrophenolica]